MDKLSWGGVFAVRKHINSVDAISLEDMDEADWDILDFPALRPAARAKLIRIIESGRLDCFFRVNYDMHKARAHGGKPTYYYPGTAAKRDAFENGEYGESNFENFDDYDEEVDAEFPSFEQRRTALENSSPDALVAAVYAVYSVANDSPSQERSTVGPQRYRPQRDFSRLPEWALALLFLAKIYALPDRNALGNLARRIGATEEQITAARTKDELIDLIVSLI